MELKQRLSALPLFVALATSLTFCGKNAPLTKDARTTPSIAVLSPSSGPVEGGTHVFILGSNFDPVATNVFFDSSAATVVSATTSSLEVITPVAPHGAGAAMLLVMTPGGMTMMANAFTYEAPPANLGPLITSIDPATGPMTGGTLVTITGARFVNGATVTLGGVQCFPVFFVNANTLQCTTGKAPRPGKYDLVVTNPDRESAALLDAFAYEN